MPLSAKSKLDLESFTRLTINTLEGDTETVLNALRGLIKPNISYQFSLASFLEVEVLFKLLKAPYKVIGEPVHNSHGEMTGRAALSPEDHLEAVELIKSEIHDGILRIESGETVVKASDAVTANFYQEQDTSEIKTEAEQASTVNPDQRTLLMIGLDSFVPGLQLEAQFSGIARLESMALIAYQARRHNDEAQLPEQEAEPTMPMNHRPAGPAPR